MAKDPVCGMDVDPKKAAGKSAYKERDIYFCSLKCKERFDKDRLMPPHRGGRKESLIRR